MVIDKTYTHSDFRGQIFMPAPVTPFAPGGDLMLDAYSEILEWYLGHQADALLIAGNNGEGYALSSDELRQVTETALKTVAGRVPIFVHVSRTSNAESIALARVAADAGAPGICLMGQPFIHAATKAEIVARFEAVAKAVPLPMLAFNSMHYTQFCLTPDILSAIADVAPVCAVKNTVTDFDHITTMIAELGDRFPIMWGGATTLITGLLLGSGGFVGEPFRLTVSSSSVNTTGPAALRAVRPSSTTWAWKRRSVSGPIRSLRSAFVHVKGAAKCDT